MNRRVASPLVRRANHDYASHLGGRPDAGGDGNRRLRRLDAVLGPRVVRLLGARRAHRGRPASPSRIGVMKTVGIGDMVLATSVVADLRAAFPHAALVVFAGPDNAAIARLIPDVETVVLPTARPWRAIPLLRAAKLDVLVDLGQWTRLEAVYTALSAAHWTVGFDTPGYSRHHAYDAAVPHSGAASELQNFQAVVRSVGIPTGAAPHLPGSGTAVCPVAGPFAVFHLWPGGFRSELREWPSERWYELAARLIERGVEVIVTGGPADVDRSAQFVGSCADLAPHVTSVSARYTFDELVELLRAAACVVSVNTGIMHLAAAVGAPTVALNGPTSSLRWGPTGPRIVNVDSDLPGCGFLNLGFEYDGERHDCMLGVSVERVAQSVMDIIGG